MSEWRKSQIWWSSITQGSARCAIPFAWNVSCVRGSSLPLTYLRHTRAFCTFSRAFTHLPVERFVVQSPIHGAAGYFFMESLFTHCSPGQGMVFMLFPSLFYSIFSFLHSFSFLFQHLSPLFRALYTSFKLSLTIFLYLEVYITTPPSIYFYQSICLFLPPPSCLAPPLSPYFYFSLYLSIGILTHLYLYLPTHLYAFLSLYIMWHKTRHSRWRVLGKKRDGILSFTIFMCVWCSDSRISCVHFVLLLKGQSA